MITCVLGVSVDVGTRTAAAAMATASRARHGAVDKRVTESRAMELSLVRVLKVPFGLVIFCVRLCVALLSAVLSHASVRGRQKARSHWAIRSNAAAYPRCSGYFDRTTTQFATEAPVEASERRKMADRGGRTAGTACGTRSSDAAAVARHEDADHAGSPTVPCCASSSNGGLRERHSREATRGASAQARPLKQLLPSAQHARKARAGISPMAMRADASRCAKNCSGVVSNTAGSDSSSNKVGDCSSLHRPK
mmetsp:Transcript_29333/g.64265  ORF Transcript_29333/g.64265 Transcript_29333/m.64265 type:complete len:251 (+) Transcript_29333:93-845(+)|eukprot:3769297-Pleurochrysis_carterae.AAC.2